MPHRLSEFFLMLAWLLLVFIIPTAGAATLTVNTLDDTDVDDNWCTLREAITAANNNADHQGCTGTNYGDDTIRFDVSGGSGTISLGSTLPDITDPAGLTIDGTGQAITISGNNSVRVMSIASDAKLTLEQMTVANGNSQNGGAIHSTDATLIVNNSTFSSNNGTSHGGGAIFSGVNSSGSGTLTVNNSTFSYNNDTYRGGAISFVVIPSGSGTLTVNNSTFSHNNATGSTISLGGAINIEGDGTFATITNSTFSSNSATTGGGGINNYNKATLTVTNSTFSGNSAGSNGGGISNRTSATLTVTNSTFSGNSAGSGGGIYSNSVLNLQNTILANSPSGGDCGYTGTLNVFGVNLVMDGTCGSNFPNNTDPLLVSLADNGGPTQTMALQSESPAIDAADNTICADSPVDNLDQRGMSRPHGSQCDIGAYEYDAIPPTTTTITSDNPDPSVVGQTVAVNYTVVANTSGVGTPTGNVTVTDGAVSCTDTVAAGSCNLTFTSAGTKTLTASYAGNISFVGSTSANAAHQVDQASTTTTITSDNPDPSVVSQTVTVNYAVMVTSPGAGTPTGNVTVSDGTVSCTGTVAAGTCNLTFTSAGTKTLTAAYVGDANFNGSSSSTESHQVLATTAQGDAGGGTVTATITDGTCIGFANSPPPSFSAAPTPLPTSVTFPYGVFGFTAVCPSNGTGTLTLTLTYPKPLPAGTQYWKYGPTPDNTNPHWYVLPATIAGNTITVTLTDGALGDSDLAPNGTIQDPGGPGVSSTTGIPTLSEWALLIFTALFGGLLWQARRRFS